jgi:hypothetical protein
MHRRVAVLAPLVVAILLATQLGARGSAPRVQRIGFLYPPTVPEIVYFYQLPPNVSGTVTSRWIAEDVGDVAPPNYLIDSASVTLDPGAEGSFTLSRPNRGWPLGKYRMELSVNGELATVEPFVIQQD